MRVSNKVYSLLKTTTLEEDWALELDRMLPMLVPPTVVDSHHLPKLDND